MPDSEAKKTWMKVNTTFIGLKLNNKTDRDLIEKLKQQESMQGYIKDLIRQDIQKTGK